MICLGCETNPHPDYESVDLLQDLDLQIKICWITCNSLQNNVGKFLQQNGKY